jgi:hypothetical protein
MSRALAVETRVPEPDALDDALLPPLAAAWGRHAIVIQDFMARPGAEGCQVMQVIGELLDTYDDCPF